MSLPLVIKPKSQLPFWLNLTLDDVLRKLQDWLIQPNVCRTAEGNLVTISKHFYTHACFKPQECTNVAHGIARFILRESINCDFHRCNVTLDPSIDL